MSRVGAGCHDGRTFTPRPGDFGWDPMADMEAQPAEIADAVDESYSDYSDYSEDEGENGNANANANAEKDVLADLFAPGAGGPVWSSDVSSEGSASGGSIGGDSSDGKGNRSSRSNVGINPADGLDPPCADLRMPYTTAKPVPIPGGHSRCHSSGKRRRPQPISIPPPGQGPGAAKPGRSQARMGSSPHSGSLTPTPKGFYNLNWAPLGEGSVGTVFVREDTKMRKPTVRKTTAAKDARALYNEIACLASCDHPAIPKSLGCFQDVDIDGRAGDAHCLMERMPGWELGNLLRTMQQVRSSNADHNTPLREPKMTAVIKDRLTEADTRRCAATLLSGLAHMHDEAEVVHRDLSWANVLINLPELARLQQGAGTWTFDNARPPLSIIDLDLAWSLTDGPPKGAIGNPMLMAPEVRSVRRYDAKCDVWSAGWVIRAMLLGELPEGRDFDKKPERLVQTPSLLEPPFISPLAYDLLGKMLQPNPAKRITAAATLQHPWFGGFDWDANHLPTPAVPSTAAEPVPTPGPAPAPALAVAPTPALAPAPASATTAAAAAPSTIGPQPVDIVEEDTWSNIKLLSVLQQLQSAP